MRPAAGHWTAFASALLVLGTTACSDDADVSRAIGVLVRERQVETVVLSDATRFAWDEVYLFKPYTPRSRVCSTLGIRTADCVRTIAFESRDDGEMSFAFLHRGRLVRYLRHGRGNGDFTPVPTRQPLSPATAVFRVVTEDADGRTWFRLVLAAPVRGVHPAGDAAVRPRTAADKPPA